MLCRPSNDRQNDHAQHFSDCSPVPGDKLLINLSGLSPKGDCSLARVNGGVARSYGYVYHPSKVLKREFQRRIVHINFPRKEAETKKSRET